MSSSTALVAQAHDRMPVVLSREDAEVWTDPKAEPGELRALMVPCPPAWTGLEDAGPVAKGKAKPEGETLL